MNGSLLGRRVIITGASGGIGAGALTAFREEGAQVVAIHHRTAPPEQLGGVAKWMECDVTQKANVDRVFADAIKHLDGLDVLIHAAGMWRPSTPESLTEEDLDLILSANLKSTLFTNQAAFSAMKASGGRIVNFGSYEAVAGSSYAPQYSISKGAVHSWTRSAARAWGQYGITVNAVAPAAETSMSEFAMRGFSADQREAVKSQIRQQMPMGGQLGDAYRDIAPTLVFLASAGSHFVTGQLLSVTGGLLMMGA